MSMWKATWTHTGMHLFARLGVADVLAAGPPCGMTADEIAAEIGACGSSLGRLLRLCSALDFAFVSMVSMVVLRALCDVTGSCSYSCLSLSAMFSVSVLALGTMSQDRIMVIFRSLFASVAWLVVHHGT